jgi:hypothetical protein
MKIAKAVGVLLVSLLLKTLLLIPRLASCVLKTLEAILRITRTTIDFFIEKSENEFMVK